MAEIGVTSEVGRLRTVLLHRPGPELSRLTPRNSADLLFDGLPWVARAQEEHDSFAEALHGRDWVDKAIAPLVDAHPEWGARIVKGAWWRSAINLRFFEALRVQLSAREEPTAA